MPPPPPILCATCGDKHYTRTARGWTPCAFCYGHLLSTTFIHPMLRGGEIQLPPPLLAVEPWPLTDQTGSGVWDEFRRMAWRSLLFHYAPTFTYMVLDSWRLTEIQLGRDEEFDTARELHLPPLLILINGLFDPPNKYTPELVRAVRTLRRTYGQPTWLYEARQMLPRVALALNPARPNAHGRVKSNLF